MRVLKYLLIVCIIAVINRPISVSAAEVSDELSTAEHESDDIDENVNLSIYTNFSIIIENDKPSNPSNPEPSTPSTPSNQDTDTVDTSNNQVVNGAVDNTTVNNTAVDNTAPSTPTLSGDVDTDQKYISGSTLPPGTGDDFSLGVYILLMSVSGTLVLLIIRRLLSNKNK
jgi:hypothetical protein